MKKTNIALAIFSAIALAACGGSSNDDAVDNSSNTGTVQPGINNGNVGTVQPGNNGNTNTNTGDTNTNTDDTNTNTGNNNAGNNNAGNTNTGTTTPTKPTKPTDPKKPEEPKKPTDPKKPEEPKKPMTGDVTGAEKIGLNKVPANGSGERYVGFAEKNMKPIVLSDGSKYKGATAYSSLKDDPSYGEVAYVANPTLLSKDNELKLKVAPADTKTVEVYYLDNKGKYTKAYIVKDKKNLFKQKANGALDENAVLTRDEVYVKPNNDQTTINHITAFNQQFDVTSDDVTDAIKVSELNRSKISQHEIVENDFSYNVRLNQAAQKLKVDGSLDKDSNIGGTAENLTRNVDVVLAKSKAYNLPHVMTAFLVADNQIVRESAPFASESKFRRGVYTYGIPTLSLPNIKANYDGKVFTADSQGDLSMSVEFADGNQIRFYDAKITGRDKGLPNLVLKDNQKDIFERGSIAGTAVSKDHYGYSIAFERENGKAPAVSDINVLVGDFYGSKAENTAGIILNNDGSNSGRGEVIGAFAAEKK